VVASKGLAGFPTDEAVVEAVAKAQGD